MVERGLPMNKGTNILNSENAKASKRWASDEGTL